MPFIHALFSMIPPLVPDQERGRTEKMLQLLPAARSASSEFRLPAGSLQASCSEAKAVRAPKHFKLTGSGLSMGRLCKRKQAQT
eukprot:364358-Chlamydomonas_euryale.AAC.13